MNLVVQKKNDNTYSVSTSYTFCRVMQMWNAPKSQSDIQFICDFLICLRNIPFQTFYFECCPVSGKTCESIKFEFVIIKTDLSRFADHKPFEQYLINTKNRVVSFYNLKKDSLLIVPNIPSKNYHSNSSIAPFIRNNEMVDVFLDLLSRVGCEMLKIMHKKPDQTIWLNTHGKGVSWLHIRIDTTPKYISYTPFTLIS